MFEYFYHGSIRKLVVGFGSLFNEIYIARTNSDDTEEKRIKVPISYGPKEKFVRKIRELDEAEDSKFAVENILPRMGFEITSMVYDTSRKMNSLNRTLGTRNEEDLTIKNNYSEVPYTIEFTMSIMTRSIDDGYQILEQILPQFTPDFTITMNFTELDRRVDVPIVLTAISSVEDYEGELSQDRRLITHTLLFQAKSFIFGRIKTDPLIREINLSFQQLTGE